MIIFTDLTRKPEEIVDNVVCMLLLHGLVLAVRLGGVGGGSSWCTGHHLGLLGVRLKSSSLQTQGSLGVILAVISISSCLLLGSLDLPLDGNLTKHKLSNQLLIDI